METPNFYLPKHPESASKLINSINTDAEFPDGRRINEFLRRGSMSLDEASVQPESEYPILKRTDLCMKINSTSVCIYPFQNSGFHAQKRDKVSNENLKIKNYSGLLTPSAKKRIKPKLDVWLELINTYNTIHHNQYKRKQSFITFLTLTLPYQQQHTDKEISKTCLTPYIDKLKYHFSIANYFWRAERQQNNNIHYHLLLDRYCDKIKLQELWNNTLEKLNYISLFEKKHGHRNPPTTHIKSIPVNSSAISYIMKYALKSDETKPIDGRVWLASKTILNIKPFTTTSMSSIMILFNYLLKQPMCKIFEREHNLLMVFPSKIIKECMDNIVISQYKQYLLLLYHVLYRDRHCFDKDYEFKQYYPLDFIDMEYLGTMRKIQLSQ